MSGLFCSGDHNSKRPKAGREDNRVEVWAWACACDSALPEVTFSHDLSPISSSKVTGRDYLDPQNGPAIYTSESAARRDFVGIDAPCSTIRYPLMSAIALRAFADVVPGDHFQAYPAEIHCKDGILDNYSVVRPLITRACIVEDRSDLKWSKYIPIVAAYRNIALKPGCLDGLCFAREEIMRWAYFSSVLRDALVGFRGVPEQLRKPEEMSSPFW